jgi:hypothetical protein
MARFNTSLRFEAQKGLEPIESVDIVVGIPCFNNEATVGFVIEAAAQGIAEFFPGCRGLALVSDGGSTDDTREAALNAKMAPGIERVVTVYRGPGGKGSALRAIFEAVVNVEARACVYAIRTSVPSSGLDSSPRRAGSQQGLSVRHSPLLALQVRWNHYAIWSTR